MLICCLRLDPTPFTIAIRTLHRKISSIGHSLIIRFNETGLSNMLSLAVTQVSTRPTSIAHPYFVVIPVSSQCSDGGHTPFIRHTYIICHSLNLNQSTGHAFPECFVWLDLFAPNHLDTAVRTLHSFTPLFHPITSLFNTSEEYLE